MNTHSIAGALYEFVHDVRAPISVIGGFGQALRQDASGQLSLQCQKYLDRICTNANRLQQQTDWLARLTRALQLPKFREHVSLRPLAAALLSQLYPQDSPLRVELDIADLQAVGWDPDHLRLLIESVYRYAELQLPGRESPVLYLSVHRTGLQGTVRAALDASSKRPAEANPPAYSPALEIAVLHTLVQHYPGAGLTWNGDDELHIVAGDVEDVLPTTTAPRGCRDRSNLGTAAKCNASWCTSGSTWGCSRHCPG